MATMDVRIKVTEDIIRDRDLVYYDGDISFSKSNADIFLKVKIFKAKILGRISSWTQTYDL